MRGGEESEGLMDREKRGMPYLLFLGYWLETQMQFKECI